MILRLQGDMLKKLVVLARPRKRLEMIPTHVYILDIVLPAIPTDEELNAEVEAVVEVVALPAFYVLDDNRMTLYGIIEVHMEPVTVVQTDVTRQAVLTDNLLENEDCNLLFLLSIMFASIIFTALNLLFPVVRFSLVALATCFTLYHTSLFSFVSRLEYLLLVISLYLLLAIEDYNLKDNYQKFAMVHAYPDKNAVQILGQVSPTIVYPHQALLL